MTEIINWQLALNQSKQDPAVGIRIAKLTGNEQFSTFITEVAPNQSVNPHYHKDGTEHYHIISGTGEITLTDVSTNKQSIHHVTTGNSFEITENTLHQLRNISNEPLVLMFSCPTAHLDNDRYFL